MLSEANETDLDTQSGIDLNWFTFHDHCQASVHLLKDMVSDGQSKQHSYIHYTWELSYMAYILEETCPIRIEIFPYGMKMNSPKGCVLIRNDVRFAYQ